MVNHRPVASIALQSPGITTGVSASAAFLDNFKNYIWKIHIAGKLVHYGKCRGGDWQIGKQGEMLVIASSLDEYMAENLIEGPTFTDGGAQSTDLVFNPIFDGLVRGNLKQGDPDGLVLRSLRPSRYGNGR